MHNAHHDLAKIQALVRVGKYAFSRSADEHRQALGYSRQEAEACVLALQPSNFSKCHVYETGLSPLDAYRFSAVHEGFTDPLYIKLWLRSDSGHAIIQSFHRERFLR